MLSGTGPEERSEVKISNLVNSVICPVSSVKWPTTLIIPLIELKTKNSYISVTLPLTQTIPGVSVQHAVEEINGMPEFSISQSVAARAILRSENRITNKNPFMCIGRVKVQ
jgi:hypothetical protein